MYRIEVYFFHLPLSNPKSSHVRNRNNIKFYWKNYYLMNISVCLWSQDYIVCTLQLSPHNSHNLFDIVTKYGVSHKWIFQVTITSVRASEHLLLELFYLKMFQKYIECFSASWTEVTCYDFISLFCLTIQGQHHEHPITLQGCNTKILSNPSGERHTKWP